MPQTKQAKQQMFLNILMLLGLILALLIFSPFLSTITLAVVLSIIFQPVFQWLLRVTGGRRVLSSLFTTIVVFLLIIIPSAVFISLVIKELSSALSPQGQSQVLVHISKIHLPEFLQKFNLDFKSYLFSILSQFINNIGSLFQDVVSFVVYTILAFISLVYFFKDSGKMKTALYRLLPLDKEQKDKLTEDMASGVRAVIGGYILVAVIQGVVSGIGYTIFGIPNPALWAFVAVAAAMLPTVGTSIVNIPAVIFLFLNGHTGASIGLLAWYLISIGIIDNYIGPRFISGRIKIHPLLILFSLIGGLALFGSIGFLTGPLAIIFIWSIFEIWEQSRNVT